MTNTVSKWFGGANGWVDSLYLLGLALLAAIAGKILITILLRHYRKKSDYSLFSSIIVHLGRPLNFLLPLITINLVLPFAKLPSLYLSPLSKALNILLVLAFANLAMSAIKVFEDFIYNTYKLNKADNLKERKIRTQLQFIRKTAVTVIILLSAAIILLSFESVRRIGAGLLTGVGVGGIIIGFAAQKSLANFLAGFQIAFTQPIRIDDVLVIEGEWGHVEEITLTYVVLNIWDQRRMILPINYFIEKPFQNWTRSTSEILGTVFLYVDYTFPVDMLRDELGRLLKTSPLWDNRVGILQVTDAKEKTMELRALVSAQDSSKAFDLRCYVRENLIKFIRENSANNLPTTRLQMRAVEE